MKLKAIVPVFLLMCSCCFASGWHDFELDIGDGYTICRTSTMHISLGKTSGGSFVLSPSRYDGVGPIVSYSNTTKFIFTRNIGRQDRNLFAGDTFQNPDSTKEYYFIVSKEDDSVIGPLSEADFVNHPNVLSVGSIEWTVPKNPDFWGPLLGNLYFCVLSIPILIIGFAWQLRWLLLVLGLAVIVILIIRKMKHKTKNID